MSRVSAYLRWRHEAPPPRGVAGFDREGHGETMLPRDYNPDDPYGVRLDTLVDARIEMQDAKESLDQMYGTLDAMADSMELWDRDAHRELRAAQKYVASLQRRLAINLDHVEDEIETIRDSEIEH